jgi:RNA polymerase sigma-70 factor (ECF subfamily)
MTPRLNLMNIAPKSLQSLLDLTNTIAHSHLEKGLLELVKVRSSQINGCAYCIHMHSKAARAAGETEDRIYLLDAWHEAPCYTERERAALAWTESLTLIATTHAPEEDYEVLKAHFSEEEQVNLTLAITTINAWNRMPSASVPCPTSEAPMRPDADETLVFQALRPKLLRLAYRMLGTLAESEDIVQDAWLRWSRTDRQQVGNPSAFLARTVTRLCLDYLKSARSRRESYVGFWLPEPLIDIGGSPDEGMEEAEDVSMVLMMALERLSPLERAAFLLHDVFGMPFSEIAPAIGREEATCRQLAARARTHVRAAKPRYPLKGQEGEEIARAFFDAIASNDLDGLKTMLAEDVVAYSDGGGKIPSTLQPIHGRDKVLRLVAGLSAKPGDAPRWIQAATIDGLPGFIAIDRFGTLQTTAVAIAAGKVIAFYTMRNPDKLRHIESLVSGMGFSRLRPN